MPEPNDPPSGEPSSIARVVADFLDLLEAGELTSEVQREAFFAAVPEEIRVGAREACENAAVLRVMLGSSEHGEQAWEDPIGMRIGDFHLLERIGAGGMSVVYLAEQVSLERKVALKLLPPHLSAVESKVRRLVNEAIAEAMLEHPGIVRIYTAGEHAGIHYLAMEYIDGHDLGEELAILSGAVDDKEPLSTAPQAPGRNREVARLVAEIAEALQFAHERRVIHRDIKPQNVLLDRDGKPHIVDFGLARILDRPGISREGDLAGSYPYMSPELSLAHRVKVDHRTDIFSLGVVFYELLTLRRPFSGTTSQQLLQQINFWDPPAARSINPLVHRDLDILCRKALEKNPQHRFASAGELALELRRFLAGDPIVTHKTPLPVRLWRKLLRHRGVAAAVLLACTMLVAGIAMGTPGEPRGRVTVRAPGHAGAAVSYRSIDVRTGKVLEERVSLGRAPVVSRAVPRGYHRFIVEVKGVGFAEMTRWIDEDEEHTLSATIRPAAEAIRGMQLIAGGSFLFGRNNRRAEVPAFSIDECEVSIGDYRRFVAEQPARRPSFWPPESEWDDAWNDKPVSALTLHDMLAYAEWAGKRLPTLMEWERAARGRDGWHLPWTRDFGGPFDDRALVGLRPQPPSWRSYLSSVAPIRSVESGRTPSGLFHLLGNVEERTETLYIAKDQDPSRSRPTWVRLVGGHAWREPIRLWRLSMFQSDWKSFVVGFRCAKSVKP